MDSVFALLDLVNVWVLLIFAIFCSAFATTSLKFLGGGSSKLTLIGVVVGYTFFLFLITLVMRRIDMSIGYAVWAGLSTVLMTISGAVFFKEQLTVQKIISLTLVVVGVIVLNLADAHLYL